VNLSAKLFGWLKLPGYHAAIGAYPRNTPLQSLRYVVLDTEFSSRDKRSNRLLSVGAVAMEGARIRMGEQFYRVLNPGVEVPASSIVVHGLRQSDIEQGEPPAEVLKELRDYIGGAVLVGHFIKIDLDLLREELRAIHVSLDNPAVDTARVHRWLLRKGGYSEDLHRRLEIVDLASLAKHYKVELREAHHALDDAFVTACIWQKLIHRLEAQNVHTIAELMKIGAP
jgi:DNA polymerase III epsilon subunit-like protein